MNSDVSHISRTTKELTQLIIDTTNLHNIKTIICNGDIKHHTKDIKVQELQELRYFTEELTSLDLQIIFIKGNHDHLLEFLLPYVNTANVKFDANVRLGSILISHGHQDLNSDELLGVDTIILSHEHPAYTFTGPNRARAKLPAFVSLKASNRIVIILPASNEISSGVDYPPRKQSDFLSPFLRNSGELESIEIFPIDPEFGLFELPATNLW
jgi:putative SbcD/Mre11-related phosphoesterase